MKKKQFVALSIFSLTLASCAMHEPEIPGEQTQDFTGNENFISIQEALDNAQDQFSVLYGNKSTRSGAIVESIENKGICKSSRSEEDSIYGYYLVNYKNQQGFALLSADKRRRPVLALSNTGNLHFSDTLQNDGLNWYMNEALPQFDYEIDLPTMPNRPIIGIDTTIHAKDPWLNDAGKKVYSEPLLAKKGFPKFHQKAPYNKYCFTANGKQAVVGCLPLAVGTVMGYYQWPNSYKTYSFNWSAMYSNFNQDSWSRLFERLGSSVLLHSTYGVDATSAGESWILYTFATMGYKSTSLNDFSSITLDAELEAGNPVICLGRYKDSTTKKDVGHAWIIDGGYMRWHHMGDTNIYPDGLVQDYFYHCIWGWNGISDGYFLLKYGKLGGKPDTADGTYYNVACDVYGNLRLVYGYRPNK